MSQFVHEKDKYGHDYWYLDGGDVRSAPAGHITDFRQQLTRIKNMELRPDDVIMAAFPKSGNNWIHHMATMLMEGTT
ncbi:hypothetical protein BaRGS_00030017 [Batillaria attramentaria]|uniref:Sulfotransferase domain-containing protein n=1 Tax=Batillaria attramentaria TaxID=370345 RepID=A0ABD0JUZ1_9CAEN